MIKWNDRRLTILANKGSSSKYTNMQFEIFRPVTVFDIFLFDFSISISIILKTSDPGKQMMNSLSCKIVKKYDYTYLLDEIWSKCVFV